MTNEELKPNMYVRTKLGIAKYLGKGTCENPFTREIEETDIDEFDKLDEKLWSGDVPNWVFECDIEDIILKASYNLIDLIEVGDYVNGHRVENIIKDTLCSYIQLECVGYYVEDYEYIDEKDIKSIVTKEQFEGMQYVVKR